jgi:hypothetical protein
MLELMKFNKVMMSVLCQKGKQSRKTFSNLKSTCALDILDLVQSDQVGPLEGSLGGSKWIWTSIDGFSRMAFTYFLNLKIKHLVSLRISKQQLSW